MFRVLGFFSLRICRVAVTSPHWVILWRQYLCLGDICRVEGYFLKSLALRRPRSIMPRDPGAKPPSLSKTGDIDPHFVQGGRSYQTN